MKCKVKKNIIESGKRYKPGDEIELDMERAMAIGDEYVECDYFDEKAPKFDAGEAISITGGKDAPKAKKGKKGKKSKKSKNKAILGSE